MPSHRACDRCYKWKQQCIFKNDAEICSQCEGDAAICTTLRLQLRQGRRPKVKPIGAHGAMGVWEVSSVSSSSNQRSIIRRVTRLPTTATHGQIIVPHTRALSPVSQIRGANWSALPYMPTESPYRSNITFVEQSPFETTPGIINRFYATYDLFMFGPSFAMTLRGAFHYSYLSAPRLLQDILYAMYPVTRLAKLKASPWDQTDIAKGTNSLQILRTAEITGSQEAVSILALGQALAAFDLLTYSISPLLVLRFSLSSIRPWYWKLSINPSLEPVIITSILWDTIDCLVKREIPVLKFIPGRPQIVDRMAGLCTTILPIFFDLCVASKNVKCQLESGSQIDFEALQSIQQSIISWEPEIPRDFNSTFSGPEIVKMQAQASMYRNAALLICHRMLHPIGTLDDTALQYARSIMDDFSKFSALVPPGTTLQNVTFPILIAALEIRNVPKETWRNIALSAAAPTCVAKMLAFVEYVWVERELGFTDFILNLVDTGPDFDAIP
ncbi:hypothetical protein BP6252_05987 [Coleophoma cylindrospora]|uniref:Zn(2)-C6 fungal-type domain-containing protein n=1 Tax=Coleophoma cylindrospora TaxID=1849047 RepID=A0A3D8RLB9_9HELO|nr:hypothetical protein BP6252_05987 [Coleophoma cylindrospora]